MASARRRAASSCCEPTTIARSRPATAAADAARRLADAIPGASLGYDPMRAASRDPGLARDPGRMLRHLQRRSAGVAFAYLRFDVVVASEAQGFPLVARLLDLGIETDAWTVNPGPRLDDATLRALVEARVRQITTDAPSAIAQCIAALYPAGSTRRVLSGGRP